MPETSVRNLIAIPYDPARGDGSKNTVLLDYLVEHPAMFSSPASPDERRLSMAHHLVNPANIIYEVWRGGTFSGIFTLTRILPRVDALFHFVFVDGNLLGKRDLILAWMGKCYQEFGFRRLAFEVPETVPGLIKFARHKLGFKYEGQDGIRGHTITDALEAGSYGLPQTTNAHVWIAKAGSRREASHWVPPSERAPGRWVDVITLRQTAVEYQRFMEERSCQHQSSPQESPPLEDSPGVS